jgi:hypothetical protein
VRIAGLRRVEAPAILADLNAWLIERAGDTHFSIGKGRVHARDLGPLRRRTNPARQQRHQERAPGPVTALDAAGRGEALLPCQFAPARSAGAPATH